MQHHLKLATPDEEIQHFHFRRFQHQITCFFGSLLQEVEFNQRTFLVKRILTVRREGGSTHTGVCDPKQAVQDKFTTPEQPPHTHRHKTPTKQCELAPIHLNTIHGSISKLLVT